MCHACLLEASAICTLMSSFLVFLEPLVLPSIESLYEPGRSEKSSLKEISLKWPLVEFYAGR